MESHDRTWMHADVGMTNPEADDFLFLLANDDAFRARLEADPEAVLDEYRIKIDEGSLPERIELPSKEDVAEFLERTRLHPYGGGPGGGPPTPPVLGFAVLTLVLGTVPLPSPPPPPPPPES